MTQIVLDYKSLPVHAPFHQSTAYERCAFGGYGSGKSWALCAEALAVALEQPGSKILLMRKTIPSLRDTTEAIFTSLIPHDLWKQCTTSRMGNHYESITFPNGSVVLPRSLDDWQKLKSHSVAYLFYDEADEIDEDTYVGMMSRVRQREPTPLAKKQGAPPITRRGIVCAANPAGKNWLWKRFVGPDKADRAEWFKSSSLDNPFLPLSYIDSLLDMPDPWVRRYVLCSFDSFGGQIYETWNHDDHMIAPYKNAGIYHYDPAGMFIMGFDPGTSAGNAATWCYYDRDKHRLVAIANYNESGLAADVHATAWRRIEAEHRMIAPTRVADPKAITVRDRGSNMGLDAQYRRLGFNFQLGTNDTSTRLYALGQLIAQKRFVCTHDTAELFERIANYRWEDLTPAAKAKGQEAKPNKKDSDLVESAQYLAARYIAPPKVAAPSDTGNEHMDEIRMAIRKQIRAARQPPPHDLGGVIL